jgi:pimeloyl-ACP methyl ester carboxylesterase
VATFALIHGGGGSAWDWHLVVPELRGRGQQAVAVDLPSDDESAGWWDYSDAVVDAVGYRSDLVVVGHSLGDFTAPLVCARVPVNLVVLLAAMIPAPGELFSDWWTNTRYQESGYDDVFYHDIAPELAAEARRENGTRIPGRCASRGRCRRGRRSRRSICCAVRTACSPPSVRWPWSAWRAGLSRWRPTSVLACHAPCWWDYPTQPSTSRVIVVRRL